MKINLKDNKGRIIRVDKDSCYPPDEKGEIGVNIGGFSYFVGKPTKEATTHKPLLNGPLSQRGNLIEK